MRASRVFADRDAAAAELATRLDAYRNRHPLIIAIPRGGVPIGQVLAQRLGGDLDIVLAHKLGLPFDPECAIGAIDETGWTYIFPNFEAHVGSFIEPAKTRQLTALKQQRARYKPSLTPIDPGGRLAIVVDDGLATGATMIAALHAIRAAKPAELVCAVPVAASASLAAIVPLVDELVCLYAPRHFGAVSLYYKDFPPVEDEEVARILASTRRT